MTNLAELPAGHEFTPVERRLQPQDVHRYVQAVQESNDMFQEGDLVPPAALGAYALGIILQEVDLPAGTVHAAQDMSFSGPVDKRETIVFRARVAQNSVRGGWRFLAIDFTGADSRDKQVIEGRSTVLVPEDNG